MKVISYKDPDFDRKVLQISEVNSFVDPKIENTVSEIISGVKDGGDEFIIDSCNKFDGSDFKDSNDLLVSKQEIDSSIAKISKKLLESLEIAYDRVKYYHKKQIPQDFEYKDKLGITLGNRWQSIESVCVYAPGGTAVYPSSIIMSAVPAIVAGVKNIVATVPSKNGKINDSVLAACKICGIDKVYKIGGAAAVAAFAHGTQTIKKVNKIVGPGNSYVALAKRQLFGTVGIDMIAGPTDILVISDSETKPAWVAADLLSQLEHGVDSRAILITDDEKFVDLVMENIYEFTKNLDRKDIIRYSLENSYTVIVKDILNDSPKITNLIAPEHLEIMTNSPKKISEKITNAGAIFLGRYTPEAFGDYIAGPSHTLPTMSSAKFSSGLSVFDFLKRISTISCSKGSFYKLQDYVSVLANAEGFSAHKLSSDIR